ncbi:hypothetical protein IAT38_004856 [Cryptococcus sp. DSM 104549]
MATSANAVFTMGSRIRKVLASIFPHEPKVFVGPFVYDDIPSAISSAATSAFVSPVASKKGPFFSGSEGSQNGDESDLDPLPADSVCPAAPKLKTVDLQFEEGDSDDGLPEMFEPFSIAAMEDEKARHQIAAGLQVCLTAPC